MTITECPLYTRHGWDQMPWHPRGRWDYATLQKRKLRFRSRVTQIRPSRVRPQRAGAPLHGFNTGNHTGSSPLPTAATAGGKNASEALFDQLTFNLLIFKLYLSPE